MSKSTPNNKNNKNFKFEKEVINMTAKTRKTILSRIASLVLAMILCLSVAIPALAADPDPRYASGTDADNPAQAAITKIFKIPVNTTTPEADFTFKITPIGINGGTDTTDMPQLGNGGEITITFAPGEAETFEDDDGTRYLVKQSADLLANILPDGLGGSDWDAGGPGIYRYEIEEIAGGIAIDNPNKEFDWYSSAKYELEIWVEEDEYGVLFAKYIIGYYIQGSEDEYYTIEGGTTGANGKLDPTPGDEDEQYKPGTPAQIGEKYSDIIFTNKYWKTDGDINDKDKKTALEIEKIVVANDPDAANKPYTFTVKVTAPAVVSNPGPYDAYIVPIDSNYATLGSPISFASGFSETIELKHNEKLVFFDLEVGAIVEVSEKVESNTRVKYERTFSTLGEFSMLPGDTTTSNWGFPDDSHGDGGTHYTEEGASWNTVKFTNTVTGVAPTGISVDDLPYVILIAVGVLAIAGFIVFKIRKNTKDDECEIEL